MNATVSHSAGCGSRVLVLLMFEVSKAALMPNISPAGNPDFTGGLAFL